jgi:hypothetical protein
MLIKGMNKDMTCKGHQYEQGGTVEVFGVAKCCDNGIHYVEAPGHAFAYYSPGTSRYFEVEPLGNIDKKHDHDSSEDSK